MMRILASFLLSLLLVGFAAPPDNTLQQDNLPLVILVRDGAGNPLSGVPLEILRTGPPHEPFDSCVTDNSGTCTLLLQPGAYLVQFSGGWRGLSFVPPGLQNGGAMDDAGAAGGGFGIYLEPGSGQQLVTFVIGQRDGELIPLWDMSRDPVSSPQPFTVSSNPFDINDDPLAAIDLGPLDDLQPLQATLDAEDAQVVESQIGGGDPTESTPESTPSAIPEGEEASIGGENIGLGLAALAVITSFVAAVLVIVRRFRKRNEEG